ncbi:MAG: hypothetical protein Q8S55_11745 [Methylococcaceae bacterium]|nr:hypothetical protein [Methylococcaceae bacterium]
MTSDQFNLPPRVSGGDPAVKDERIYRTCLNTRDYLRLEIEAMERGLKPFGLTKSVMTLYINKQLIFVRDLPPQIQTAIINHQKSISKPVSI